MLARVALILLMLLPTIAPALAGGRAAIQPIASCCCEECACNDCGCASDNESEPTPVPLAPLGAGQRLGDWIASFIAFPAMTSSDVSPMARPAWCPTLAAASLPNEVRLERVCLRLN